MNPLKISISSIYKRMTKSLNLTPKVPNTKNYRKFSKQNLERYLNYLLWINQIPNQKVLFIDESHFDNRGLHYRKAWSTKGKRIVIPDNLELKSVGNLIVLTSLSSPSPIIYSFFSGTCNQLSFLSFIMKCILDGYIKRNDYVVMDNWPGIFLKILLKKKLFKKIIKK
jgi:hypothetical protein